MDQKCRADLLPGDKSLSWGNSGGMINIEDELLTLTSISTFCGTNMVLEVGDRCKCC